MLEAPLSCCRVFHNRVFHFEGSISSDKYVPCLHSGEQDWLNTLFTPEYSGGRVTSCKTTQPQYLTLLHLGTFLWAHCQNWSILHNYLNACANMANHIVGMTLIYSFITRVDIFMISLESNSFILFMLMLPPYRVHLIFGYGSPAVSHSSSMSPPTVTIFKGTGFLTKWGGSESGKLKI